MDVVTIINELRRELERIDGLILALEALQSGRRRGRPPKALQALKDEAIAGSSPAARRAAAAVKQASNQSRPRTKSSPKKSPTPKGSASKT